MIYKLKKENFKFLIIDVGLIFNPNLSIFANSISTIELVQNIFKKISIALIEALTNLIIQLTKNKPSLNTITVFN